MSAALGVVVEGADLRSPTPEMIDQLSELLDRHLVVAIRGQRLTESEHMAVTSALGTPWIHPIDRLRGKASAQPVTVEATSDEPLGTDSWHVDFPYLPSPPSIGILNAIEVPSYGGDTMWLNLQLAYERLPDRIRADLDGVGVNHSIGEFFLDRYAGGDPMLRALWKRVCVGNTHPVVRAHPRTGKPSVYTLDTQAELVGFEGSDPSRLMAELVERSTSLNFTCRWRWQEGDVVFYDQAATFHRLIIDPWPGVRRMRRTLVEGQPPTAYEPAIAVSSAKAE